MRGPDHVFVAVNAAYADASGTTSGLIGRAFRDVFPAGAVHALDEVYATGKPQLGPDGVAGIRILAVDMTDAERARQALVELSAEELALLDLVPSAIVVLDHRGAVAKVNSAAKALLGDSPFTAVRSLYEALARALAGEAFRDLRIRIFLPPRGREGSLRIDAEPLRAPDGAVRAVVAALTEVDHSVPA